MRRETFSSLRAVHEASRIAAAVAYRHPIDLSLQPCPHCNQQLALRSITPDWTLSCPACHETIKLPSHIITQIQQHQARNAAEFPTHFPGNNIFRPTPPRWLSPTFWVSIFLLFLIVFLAVLIISQAPRH